MASRWKSPTAVVGGLAILVGSLSLASAAGASDGHPDRAATTIAATADAAAGGATVWGADGGGAVTADLGAVDVEVPLDPTAGLSVDPDAGPALTIGIPGSHESSGVVADGSVVYEGVAPDAAVVARPTVDGVQALVVIEGPDAPTTYRFAVEVGSHGAGLVPAPGGAVEVRIPGSSAAVATVLPPWASDANGRAVPTRFEIRGSTIVQVVEHEGAAYPVVADPHSCGIVTCTQYFGKMATGDIASGGPAGLLCGGVLKVLPPAGVGCAAAVAAVVIQASRARNRGMCLKVKYTRGLSVAWYPDIYRGGYCR